jgi:hypothetical protein
MSAIQVRGVSGSVALTGGAAKTVLQIVAPANQRLKLTNLSVSFDGTTNTATPAQVRILRQTTAGTMSAGATVLIEKELTETIQSSYQTNATAEPTAGDVLRLFTVPAFMGQYEVFYPYGQEILVQGGGRLGIEVNAPANVNCRVEAQWEE